MQIFTASDHAGFELKNFIVEYLRGKGETVEDMGPTQLNEEDDYPDYINPLAQKVAQNKGSFGIILGASGQGEAMSANRTKGVRAAVYYGGDEDMEIVRLSRQHNDSNVLSLGARFLTPAEATAAVDVWLSTAFSGEQRHARRIQKLDI